MSHIVMCSAKGVWFLRCLGQKLGIDFNFFRILVCMSENRYGYYRHSETRSESEYEFLRPGVRFSKLPRTFRARKHFGALFGCFSRVPKSVSQNTRKCPELSPDIFDNLFVLPATIMRLELAERLF